MSWMKGLGSGGKGLGLLDFGLRVSDEGLSFPGRVFFFFFFFRVSRS